MHNNELELTFGNFLILLIGLAVAWWMARAPRSFLKLMSFRVPGLDKDRPWLNSVVRFWGRFTFFSLVFGLLIMLTPASLDKTPGFSGVPLVLAIGISWFALKKPRKQDDPSIAVGTNQPFNR